MKSNTNKPTNNGSTTNISRPKPLFSTNFGKSSSVPQITPTSSSSPPTTTATAPNNKNKNKTNKHSLLAGLSSTLRRPQFLHHHQQQHSSTTHQPHQLSSNLAASSSSEIVSPLSQQSLSPTTGGPSSFMNELSVDIPVTALTSSSLLLQQHRSRDNDHANEDYNNDLGSIIPMHPRRMWKVNDTSLKPIPIFYPPLDPKCCVYINDVPPSIVAIRISECLRKRNISVEYDDENLSAIAMTIDRCHFNIHLYQATRKGSRRSRDTTFGSVDTADIDFSNGLVVECMRTRGNVITFHHTCRAILSAAQSYSTGEDNRKAYQLTALDYHPTTTSESPLKHHPKKWNTNYNTMNLIPPTIIAQSSIKYPHSSSSSSSLSKALHAMEHILELLKKDRLGPQKLAMESLVTLTNPTISGMDIAIHISFIILGVPITKISSFWGAMNKTTTTEDSLLVSIVDNCDMLEQTLLEFHHDWIMTLLEDRILPNERKNRIKNNSSAIKSPKRNNTHNDELNDSGYSNTSCLGSLLGINDNNNNNSKGCFGSNKHHNDDDNKNNNINDNDYTNDDINVPATSGIEFLDSDNTHYEDAYHGGLLRSLCLRAFTNSLELLSMQSVKQSTFVQEQQPNNKEGSLLQFILHQKYTQHIISHNFLANALYHDLSGATRPLSMICGSSTTSITTITSSRLASIHESYLSLKSLRILCFHSHTVLTYLLKNEYIISTIETLIPVGKSTHTQLQNEAKLLHGHLSVEARSC